MVFIGIVMIMLDSIMFDKDDVNPSALTFGMTKYIKRYSKIIISTISY